MAGRKMLRELMNVPDIYAQADSISQMLREDYGGYDAESFEEVLVEEAFAQRLAARGYEVRPWNAAAAPAPAPAARPSGGDVVPVQIVRRPAGSATQRPAAPAAQRSPAPAAPSAPPAATRGRSAERAASAESSAPAGRTSGTRATTTRSTPRASSGTTGTRTTATRTRRAITSDADQLSNEPAVTPTRTRRTRTTRATESDES
jgi:hypothetical protein